MKYDFQQQASEAWKWAMQTIADSRGSLENTLKLISKTRKAIEKRRELLRRSPA